MRRVVDTNNVIGVGITEKITEGKPTGTLAIAFYVNEKKPLSKMRADGAVPPTMPEAISGPQAIPTDVIAIGRPQIEVDDLPSPLAIRTPVQPGYSIAHVDVPAGTLGAIVIKGDQYLILSNCHVLANSGLGKKGDRILYPSSNDDGVLPKDLIANLEDFIELKVGDDFLNHVDCAVAVPVPKHLDKLRADIKGLFVPRGTTKAKRGMEIVKVGRTTGETVGTVRDTHFRFIAEYPIGKVGFVDQVFCTRYSNGGDSGSLVLDRKSGKAVGLHFAGFPDKHGIMGSVFNPIDKVLKALGVKLVTKAIN
jgi:hypothetical protein